eukprot:COSAG03_NODE_26670_length_257_cov_1.639241_1_plen_81_part_01
MEPTTEPEPEPEPELDYAVCSTTRMESEIELCESVPPVSQWVAELPLVRKIFALFDGDGDARLDKEEYKSYLKAIGYWGTE